MVIDYVIDTAGRRIDFNYQNNRLTWIGQNRNGVWAYFVRIDYTPVTIQTNFAAPLTTNPVNINGAQIYLPSRLTFPTGVQHRFHYNGYAQIDRIEKWVPSIANQGVARRVAYTRFEFNLDGGFQPTDCPSFAIRFDQAENWQGGSEQRYDYSYGIDDSGSASPPYDHYHSVSDPSGRVFKLFYSGLVRIKATYAPNTSTPSKEERVTYTQDSGLLYASNLRVQQTRISDNASSVQKTSYGYTQLDGMWLPTTKDEHQGDSATVYRRTVTSYTSYPAQRILGLVSQVSVYAGPGTTLMSRVSNTYDETGTFIDSNGQTAPYFIDATADGVIQHDSAYGSGSTQRGNLTSVTQSSVVGGAVNGSRVIRRASYDTNGNARAEADGAGNRRQFVFADNYSNKPAGVGQTHAYVYTSADPTDFRAGSQYDYFDGRIVKTFNLKPGSGIEEQVTTLTYDFADRLLQKTRPDGGLTQYGYWDNWGYQTTATSTNTGQLHFEFREFDGAGRIRRKANDHPGGAAGKYSGQQFVFDVVGMQTDRSNVIAIYGDWTPQPEDAATGWIFTNTSRDELARLKLITRPDGNTAQYDYTSCGCAGTSTMTETDETGCKVKTDVYLGKEVLALQSTDGNFYWSHTDHLSSGRMLTTMSGTVVYRASFHPFGQVAYGEWSAAGNTNLNTRKFTGYERDATGPDYARARSYTSRWGRFIQADPLGSGYLGQTPNPLGAANQGRPQTLNRYSYVSNDPINNTDPSGLLRRAPDDGCVYCGGDDVVGSGGGGMRASRISIKKALQITAPSARPGAVTGIKLQFCGLGICPYLKIAPLVPTTQPQSGAMKNSLERFACVLSSTLSHVAPPSVVCSSNPRSPAIQPPLGPSLDPSFAFTKTTSLRFCSTFDVCWRHCAPPFVVVMIAPRAPTAQPRSASTKYTARKVCVTFDDCSFQLSPPSTVRRIVPPAPTAQARLPSITVTS